MKNVSKLKKIQSFRKEIIKSKHSGQLKPFLKLYADMLSWLMSNQGQLDLFFILGMHKKGKNISEVIYRKTFRKYYDIMYPEYYRCLLEDKLVFEKFINNYPEFAPVNLGFLTSQQIYWEDGRQEPIENLTNYDLDCIVKESRGFGGGRIFLLKITEGIITINGNGSTVSDIQKLISCRSVMQELLKQHEKLEQLYPTAINTARIVTVFDGRQVTLFNALLRVGNDGNFVDNASQGNIFIGIDQETGMLKKYAYRERGLSSTLISSHPQTAVVFENFQLPYFENVVNLCKRLHRQLHFFFILGWDVAFTADGPKIIECN
ncbi:MAG TPA: sugar-transfer associated ATP-grasp domain-containing protein, partial [Bacteroidales bacterium]|nr:sugar-transfer associated ATP-grasp domain-containing protein [Bacteroidales bacterium]